MATSVRCAGRLLLSRLSQRQALTTRSYAAAAAKSSSSPTAKVVARESPPPSSQDEEEEEDVPTSRISRPLAEILKELNKKIPDSLVKSRVEADFTMRYVPWHILNRILNLHAPEWSGEVRSIVHSADGKSVSVVYRVTLYGTDAEIYREATGTASLEDTTFGDPVQKAEAMAFRRACARLGLGLHLYHEEMS